MKTTEAKRIVAQALQEQGIEYKKLTARTVSFQDLSRDSAVFVTIHGVTRSDPWRRSVKEALPKGVHLEP